MPELDKYRETASQKLELIISYLGVTAKVSSSEVAGKKLKLKVESEDAGRIIGRRGRTLSSIQLLLNSAMHQSDEPLPEIVIEIEGYDRHKRQEDGKGRRKNSKRDRNDRNDKKRGGRNDGAQNNEDTDSDADRKKSRRRNTQKSDENRSREDGRSKPKDRVSKEDSEYFVDPDEIKASANGEEAPAATNDIVEQADVANEPAETVAETPTDTVAEAPADTVAEAPADTVAETSADTVAETPAEAVSEPATEPAEKPAAEPAEKTSSEQLPDNVYQCRQKALDAAKEVRRWGEEVTLRGMTGEERKAVKEALNDDPLIDVVEGEVTGPDKRKVIIRERSIEKALND